MGLVGVHYQSTFYEAVPWTGSMEWEVTPWGYWKLVGRCTSTQLSSQLFEVEVIAQCSPTDNPGMKLRAPTETRGMVYMCRDSFYGTITVSLYHLEYNIETKTYQRSTTKAPILDHALSKQGAVEVGGDPWDHTWRGQSIMKQPMKGLVQFPYLLQRSKEAFRNVFRRRRK